MSDTGRAIAIGPTILVEGCVIWRVMRALNRGVIKMDPVFWTTDTFGFEFTFARASSRFWYWFGIVTTVIVGLVVLVICAAIVASNLH